MGNRINWWGAFIPLYILGALVAAVYFLPPMLRPTPTVQTPVDNGAICAAYYQWSRAVNGERVQGMENYCRR